jgi:uncharacterized membrane protein YidH (DUF202 family)
MTSARVALPVERTALSWRRTAIAATANLVMLVKLTADAGWALRFDGLLSYCGLLAMAVTCLLCVLRDRALRHGRYRAPEQVIVLVTVVVGVVGVLMANVVLYLGG